MRKICHAPDGHKQSKIQIAGGSKKTAKNLYVEILVEEQLLRSWKTLK